MPSIEESAEAGALKAIESPKFSERLKSVFTGELQTKLATAEASITTKDAEIQRLTAALATAQEAEKAAKGELATMKASLSTAETDLKAAKEALEAKEGEVERRANTKAGEQIAKAGHRPVKEQDKNTPVTQGADVDEIRAEMAAETDPKKKMALARQCREARGQADIFNPSRN
jgi:chromosome segregation ATPase